MRTATLWAAALALAGAVCDGSPARAQAQDAGFAPAKRIVVFRRGISPSSRIRLVEQAGGKVTHDLWIINAVGVQFQPKSVRAAEVGLAANPAVLRVENDFEQKWIEAAAASSMGEVELPAISAFLRPLNFKNRLSQADPELPWGIERVKAPKAWAVTRGAGVKVAVIDTGIDYNHPDLKANVKGGWNATNKEKENEFLDDNGHGTHVAGTIAAVRNAQGVAGVAPEAALYGVKVLSASGSGTFADVIAGMQWTADPAHKMDVVNMSLGASQGTESLADTATALAKAGVTVIAAAGNSGGPVGFPAAYPEIIAVSASNSADKIAYFSSRGPEVAVIAPGVEVKSTYMGGVYKSLSGTSMACPHTAGLAALAVAAKGLRGPKAIRIALTDAAESLPDLKPEDQGAGLVNAEKLVNP